MMKVTEEIITTFTFISIQKEGYILIQINRSDGFFVIKYFICHHFIKLVTVTLLVLSFDLSSSWNTILKIKNQRLKIRGNHMSSNILL